MKSTASAPGRGNARPAVAAAAASTTAGRGFVEFHPSMSLENAPTLACLSIPAQATPSSDPKAPPLPILEANDATLEGVLADRYHVWTKVNEMIERLTPLGAYQGDVNALQTLERLHLLCKQRETHLRALQITLLQEGRAVPSVEVATTTETDNEEGRDVDATNTNQIDWQEEQDRHFDFVDYDAIDLIELSEQLS